MGILYQADVYLHEWGGSVIEDTQTDSNGEYSFTGIGCGDYYVYASKSGKSNTTEVFSISGNIVQGPDEIRLQLNAGTRGTPVILVPGMMGSTKKPYKVFPELPKDYPCRKLKLWDLFNTCGWEELKDELEAEDFKYYECPWDWRMKAQYVYEEYLKDVIDKVLVECATTKVHIVAHSMGGLVVRSYIQSASYRGDIDKFAMVGTPNLGSSNPYYIWEGGDPKLADDITDGWGIDAIKNPYSNTLNFLWQKYHWFLPQTDKRVRDFVQDKVRSLRQLMNTKDFLMDESLCWGVNSPENENTWLKGLNNGGNGYNTPAAVMSADGSGGKVEVRLFVGKKSGSTIEYIKTKNRDDSHFRNDLYEDGIPKSPEKKNVTKGWGDGTVPLASAKWPADDGWAYLYGIQLDEKHISLVKRYKTEIVNFLKEGTVGGSLQVYKTSGASTTKGEAPVSQISFSVVGDMRLYITSPGAQSTGIDPVSGNPVENIPDSNCIFGSEGGGVSIEDPAAGVYQVTYFGEAARDFSLDVGYGDADTTETRQFRGFRPVSARTLTVSVAPAATPRITVTPLVQAPTGLQADVYSSSGEKTRLSWTASGTAGVAGYNIYSVSEDEPYFALLTTVGSGTTTYDTAHPWSSTDAVPVMTYAVAAFNGSGVESFFSNTAQNNDRDHDWATDVEEEILTTDPNVPDTDGDGLLDGEEENYGTNPKFADTDGDGFNDGVEVRRGSDPLDAGSIPVSAMPWIPLLLFGN